jgi:hypothetical protein
VLFGWVISSHKCFAPLQVSVNYGWFVLVVIESQWNLIRRCVKSIPPTSESYVIPLPCDAFREVVRLSQTNQVNNHSIPADAVNRSHLRLR